MKSLLIPRTQSIIENLKHNGERKGKGAYRLVEGPLLQQIRVQRLAMIPITTKISVVTRKPMSSRFLPDPDQRKWIPSANWKREWNKMWINWLILERRRIEPYYLGAFGCRENGGKWKKVKIGKEKKRLNNDSLLCYLWTLMQRSHGAVIRSP